MVVVDHPGCPPPMTPNNARIKKNHSKTVYNGRIVFLSIFRSCEDLKSGMSTFCQSPKIYFESKILFGIFFLKPARGIFSNAPRIIKIGSLGRKWDGFEFVDPPLSQVFQYPCSYYENSRFFQKIFCKNFLEKVL